MSQAVFFPVTASERAIAREAYLQALLDRGYPIGTSKTAALERYPDPLTYSRIMRSPSGWLVRRRSDGKWERTDSFSGLWEASNLTDDYVKALAGCLP